MEKNFHFFKIILEEKVTGLIETTKANWLSPIYSMNDLSLRYSISGIPCMIFTEYGIRNSPPVRNIRPLNAGKKSTKCENNRPNVSVK